MERLVLIDPWTMLAATASGTGVLATARHVQKARARRASVAARLDRIAVDLPLDTRHLSGPLGRLVVHARTTRLVLETPVRRCLEAPLQETPWGRRQRCNEFDCALADGRRALWEWLALVDQIAGPDRALLLQLGLGVGRLRRMLWRPGAFERTNDVFEQTLYPQAPDPERVPGLLCDAMADLRQFEIALLSYRPDPYR